MTRFSSRLAPVAVLLAGLAACSNDRSENTLVGPSPSRGPAFNVSGAVTVDESTLSTTCVSFMRTRDEVKAQLALTPSDAQLQESAASWDAVVTASCR